LGTGLCRRKGYARLERLQPVWKIVDIRPAAPACCL
jgi:hypothetical protein